MDSKSDRYVLVASIGCKVWLRTLVAKFLACNMWHSLIYYFRSSVRLTSSNIHKLKTKIFDVGNVVEGGEGDGFSYKLEDSPPVLTLGLSPSKKNLSTRRARSAIKSRRRRSHHSRGFCGEVYEYIVQMKIYRDDV